MKTIGIGMVGTGFMARTHSLAYAALPYYTWPMKLSPKKVIIADVNSELAADGANRFGYARSTDNWKDVIDDPEVEIVDIVTPNDFHAEVAIAAARKGKHVICEKPLARTAKEAEEIYKAAEKAGVRSLVAYNYRRTPAVMEAKKLIEERQLGDIYHFRGFYLQDYAIDPELPLSWRFQKSRAGSGSLGDIGSHTLDMALFLVGDVEYVTAISKTFVKERPIAITAKDVLATKREKGAAGVSKAEVDVDDVTSFLLEFSNGATGTLDATRFAYGRKNHLSFEINGQKGSVAFNWERPAELRYYDASDPGDTQGFRTILTGPQQPFGELLWPLAGFGIGYPETTILMMNEFLNEIADGGKQTTDFKEGWRNCKIMDAVLASAASGKRVKVG